MEHMYPGVLEPVQEVIENLFSLPHRTKSIRKSLSDKEETLKELERSLIRKSSEIAERELDLKERWDAGRIHRIPIAQIRPNPHQPRREFEELSLFSLAGSIREHGILQPLTVRRIPDPISSKSRQTAEQYELIAGERRLRAASAIGETEVPCIVLDADNRRAAELALIENLQRENLNMFEQASAIASLIDMHAMTQEQIAKSLSVSQSCIANKLRILRLTAQERETILSRHLTERHARAFLRIKDLPLRKDTVEYIAENNCNVAQTEQYIDQLLSRNPSDSAEGSPIRSRSSNEESSQENRNGSKKNKLILKDIRFFFNTVDRAVAVVRDAGITIQSEREESEEEIRMTIVLPRTSTNCSSDMNGSEQTADPSKVPT